MSEAKFTKGEWKASCVKVDGKEVRNGWGVNVGGATLASVYTGSTYGVVHEQQKANAHLIAAAPDMYEALVLMIRYTNMLEDQLLSRRVEVTTLYLDNKNEQPPEDIAELALAKARGEK